VYSNVREGKSQNQTIFGPHQNFGERQLYGSREDASTTCLWCAESSSRKAEPLTLGFPLNRQVGSKVLERHFGGLPTIQDAFHDIGSQKCKLKNTVYVTLVQTGCVRN
jgi:hypothetical protein